MRAAARRLDPRFIERQIDRSALEEVLHRAAVNFHGECCQRTAQASRLGADLIQQHDIWLGDPDLVYAVCGDGHLVDAIQGMTGATLGNGRLTLVVGDDPPTVRVVSKQGELSAAWEVVPGPSPEDRQNWRSVGRAFDILADAHVSFVDRGPVTELDGIVRSRLWSLALSRPAHWAADNLQIVALRRGRRYGLQHPREHSIDRRGETPELQDVGGS